MTRFADLVLPRTCGACDVALDADTRNLCAECWQHLCGRIGGFYCMSCGQDRGEYLLDAENRCSKCLEQGGRYGGYVRVGRYEGVLQAMILRFKQEQRLEGILAQLLADAVSGRIDPDSIDGWVPIPMHWRRRMQRGFQGSLLLAEGLSARLRAEVTPALRQTKYVPPFHHGVSPSARREMIKGAFALGRGCRVSGRRMVLVDDVSTTGATMEEAARVLKRAGAKSIAVAVVARAGQRVDGVQGRD